MTDLIGVFQINSRSPDRGGRVAPTRRPEPSDVERLGDPLTVQSSGGPVTPKRFGELLAAEFDRLRHGGADGLVAVISLSEVAGIRHRLGDRRVFDLITEVAQVVRGSLSSGDLYDLSEDGDIVILARDRRITDATGRVETLCAALTDRRFGGHGERLRLTPLTGVTTLSRGSCPTDVLRRARNANAAAVARAELASEAVTPGLSSEPAPPKRLIEAGADRQAAQTLAKLSTAWDQLPGSLLARVCDTIDADGTDRGVPTVPHRTDSIVPFQGCSPEVFLPRRVPGASLNRPKRSAVSDSPVRSPDARSGRHGGIPDPSTTIDEEPGRSRPSGASSGRRIVAADGLRRSTVVG